jgi:molybdopterin-containing oxidoreductase family iron-sulfur binding subunit
MIQIEGIGNQTGKKFWRSLNELASTPKFKEWLVQEFPEGATDLLDRGSRRRFMQLMAASMGLAGLTACRRPVEKILPYAKGVEGLVHGAPQHYATVMNVAGQAQPLVVEAIDGRPVKIEGNRKHPISNGAANAWAQASILSLYDPDRSQKVLEKGKASTWEAFGAAAKATFVGDGEGIRILSGAVVSPTLASLRASLAAKHPKAKWYEYEPVNEDSALAGSELAFGDRLRPHYNLLKADVVVSLDCDFLQLDNPGLNVIRDFAKRRRAVDSAVPAGHGGDHQAAGHKADAHKADEHKADGHKADGHKADEHKADAAAHAPAAAANAAAAAPAATPAAAPAAESTSINRLYVVENNFTLTGAQADHRLRLRAADVQAFAADLAREVAAIPQGLKILGQSDKYIAALAKDLLAHKGRSVVLAGPRQPAIVHALAAAINQTLGNIGETVSYTRPGRTSSAAEITELAKEVAAGQVKTLVLLGANPVYSAPADLDFGAKYKSIATTIHLGFEVDETAAASTWHLPESHALESWGDAMAADGTVSLQQPLIEPIFKTKSAIEVVSMALGVATSAYEQVKAQSKLADPAWRQALHDGFVAGSQAALVKPAANAKAVETALNAAPKAAAGLEVVFAPSASTFDGRYANNAWLQEAPEPMTKIVWDNPALVSPKTAKELKLEEGSVIVVERGGRKVEAPVLVQPGHADNSVTLTLGYGRTSVGRVGTGVGYNAYLLRTADAMGFGTGATLAKSARTYELVTTQEHHDQAGRPVVREATVDKYKEEAHFASHEDAHIELFQLFDSFDYSKGNQWGMVVDLQSCIGCNACLVACQSENNIPVVGRDQVSKGREMHWIRLDRYFTGTEDDPEVVHQPMACQQCENAPCESVCPVAATVHSPEGLNDMAYNRCVGTRYCANNCPYKVRRFNYFNWHKDIEEVGKMVFNPDVTVRMRGVMEKCNYCVQRIQEVKIAHKVDGRKPIKDGDVLTACQQTCPAEAISFGNINDPESAVSKMKKNNRNYTLLHELNIKPRTTYLAKVRNPNPELA